MGINQRIRSWIVVFVVIFTVVWSAAQAQAESGEHPVEMRARQFAAAVSSGNAEELKRFVADSFDARMQRVPMASHMNILMSFWDMSHGLNFQKLQNVQPYEAVALFSNRLTGGWNTVFFRVEQEAPHRIVAVRTVTSESPASPARKLTHRQIARDLDKFMKRLAESDVFSGSVALAHNGDIIFAEGYGQSDKNFGVPNRVDTRYNLGSMNKMFTAVAIAQLVERDLLSYDDPLSKFLPEFPDAESAKKILIKHLLSHSAGLGMYWNQRYRESAKDGIRTVDDMMKIVIGEEKVQFEPGTKFQYSNTGFLVLGKVIEKVTGGSYYDYVRKNIFEPADMKNTDCYELDLVNSNVAIGYAKSFDERGKPVFRNNLYLHSVRGGPHGGGYSTVLDLVKFDRALRSSKLLKPENAAALLKPKPKFGATRYGYGFDVNEERGTAGHGGGSVGISNNFDMFLRSGWTAVVLANYTEPAFEVSTPVVEKMRELVQAGESAR